tara:strand:+ start:171 stop:449 length:279 start_codon:yes stop_codon:yes gene_type:complete
MIGTQYIMRLSKLSLILIDEQSEGERYKLEVIAVSGEYEEVVDMHMGTHFDCIMFAIAQFTPGEFELGGEYSDEDMKAYRAEGRNPCYFCMN